MENLRLSDIVSAIGESLAEPIVYIINNSKEVWTGAPCNDMVYQYGKQIGTLAQFVVGAILGVGVGTALVKVIGKVVLAPA